MLKIGSRKPARRGQLVHNVVGLTDIAVAATPDDERKFELEGVG
jgi:thiamine biosynthesis lipoprotein ApbE